MLSYIRGLSVRPAFYAPYNEITFIVEDNTSENFYTKLFQCLWGDSVRFRRVIGVGGKEEVLRRFNSQTHVQQKRIEFYLMDGDFDELIGRPVPSHDRLYRLPRYDIESFLIEPVAIAKVAEEQNPRKSWEYYYQHMDLNQWQRELVELINKLIACLVLLHTLGIPPRGGKGVEMFELDNRCLPDKKRIDEYIDSCWPETALSEGEFNRRLSSLITRMGTSFSERTRWISGKNILLPLIARILKEETKRNISLESLRFRLVPYCELGDLSDLKRRVLSLV